MENKFIARMYHFVSGELYLVVEEFDRIEDAIEAGIKAAAHSYKVYDHNGCICHDSHGHHHPYA